MTSSTPRTSCAPRVTSHIRTPGCAAAAWRTANASAERSRAASSLSPLSRRRDRRLRLSRTRADWRGPPLLAHATLLRQSCAAAKSPAGTIVTVSFRCNERGLEVALPCRSRRPTRATAAPIVSRPHRNDQCLARARDLRTRLCREAPRRRQTPTSASKRRHPSAIKQWARRTSRRHR